MRRIPLLPTLVVLVAAAIMLRLGLWQLERLHQKEAMIAGYRAAQADRTLRPWPRGGAAPASYSRVALDCPAASATRAEAGRSGVGVAGWAHVASCPTPGGAPLRLVLGWSLRSEPVAWPGGPVRGTYVAREGGAVLFADPPLAGLQPSARPDPRDLPNNHLAYAVQWFAFAAVALVIYAIALRKRLRG
ncbi:SURF1 family protein [Novosphingobium piscinae]|uniref:SURF1-like protein n=2 Tax=Novosphingobium piscinae TaxID=1507448 RepID=A0A7X1FWS7_9SPHN|nr:SURF1 family protein [Novosphingobium piscinae]